MSELLDAAPLPPTIQWCDGAIELIDQRRLPDALVTMTCRSVDDLCTAISTLAVRGAPALGAAGAYGVALAASLTDDVSTVRDAAHQLATARPTAVNLSWGVQRAMSAYANGGATAALDVAHEIVRDDVNGNITMGRHGAAHLAVRPGGLRMLTHCNAGHLATCGYGTAVGVIRAAHEVGNVAHVWVCETRPLLQGARITAWECAQLGIAATLIVDSAAAHFMANGDVDAVIVGADRIAANGDAANKIGTYSLAVLARHHEIPFYVAAPMSTVDFTTPRGADIEIEDRGAHEVADLGHHRRGVAVRNPAFDVTPNELITAIITDKGVTAPSNLASL